jgi:putative membrane protein
MIRKALFVAALVVSTTAAAAPARSFLDDAIKGDNSEATLGRLIAARGYSAQVRNYGRTLTRDHRNARVQAAAVARSFGMRAPTSMMSEARSEYRRLERLHGRAFDREVRRYMVDDHRKDIATFVSQARSGDRRTARLAREQLPTLRKHLRLAESIRA